MLKMVCAIPKLKATPQGFNVRVPLGLGGADPGVGNHGLATF